MPTYKVAVLEDVKKTAFREVEKREPGDKQVGKGEKRWRSF